MYVCVYVCIVHGNMYRYNVLRLGRKCRGRLEEGKALNKARENNDYIGGEHREGEEGEVSCVISVTKNV
jgi:hypothetical protein